MPKCYCCGMEEKTMGDVCTLCGIALANGSTLESIRAAVIPTVETATIAQIDRFIVNIERTYA